MVDKWPKIIILLYWSSQNVPFPSNSKLWHNLTKKYIILILLMFLKYHKMKIFKNLLLIVSCLKWNVGYNRQLCNFGAICYQF